MPPKQRFYAVAKGHRTGIFYDFWSKVQKYVEQYKGAKFRGFDTEEAAKDYLVAVAAGSVSLKPVDIKGTDTLPACPIPINNTNIKECNPRLSKFDFHFTIALSTSAEIELIAKGVEGPLRRASIMDQSDGSHEPGKQTAVSSRPNVSVVLSSYYDSINRSSESEKDVLIYSNVVHRADQTKLIAINDDEKDNNNTTKRCSFVTGSNSSLPFGAISMPVSFGLPDVHQDVNQLRASFDMLYSSLNTDLSSNVKENPRENETSTKELLPTKGISNIKDQSFVFHTPEVLRASLPGICRTVPSNADTTEPLMLSNSHRKKYQYYPAVVYTDGACANNGQTGAKAGYGVHFYKGNHTILKCKSAFLYCGGKEDPYYIQPEAPPHPPSPSFISSFLPPFDIALPLPISSRQTNNVGEMTAIIAAIEWSVRAAHYSLSRSVGDDSKYSSASGLNTAARHRNLDLQRLCDQVQDYLDTTVSVLPPQMLSVWQVYSSGNLPDSDKQYPHPAFQPLHIFTDSNYVLAGITQYIYKWLNNGFLKSAGEAVENVECWKHLWNLLSLRRLQFAAGLKEQLLLGLRAHLLVDRWGIISVSQLDRYLHCDPMTSLERIGVPHRDGKNGSSMDDGDGVSKEGILEKEKKADQNDVENILKRRIGRKWPREGDDEVDGTGLQMNNNNSNYSDSETKESTKSKNNHIQNPKSSFESMTISLPYVNIISPDSLPVGVTDSEELLPDALISSLLTVDKSLLLQGQLSIKAGSLSQSRKRLSDLKGDYVPLDLFLKIFSEEAAVEFFHVKGHFNDDGNNAADCLAVAGAKMTLK